MDEATFETWLDSYGQAWEQRDGSAMEDLFTDDAAHHWTPFSEPKRGIAEIRKAFDQSVSNQRNIDFDYAVLGVVGDRGIAHWWCHLTRLGTNAAVRLDGIFCAEFRGDKCYQFREWWHTIGDTEKEVATSPAGD